MPRFSNICNNCYGKGYKEYWDTRLCMRCSGSGFEHNRNPFQLDSPVQHCHNCHGKGKITRNYRDRCGACGGSGRK